MAFFKKTKNMATGKRVIVGLAERVRHYETVVSQIENAKPRVAHGLTYPLSYWTGGGDTQLVYTEPEGGLPLTDEVRHVIATTATYMALVRAGVSQPHALLTAVHYAITYGEGLQDGLPRDIEVFDVVAWASYLSERYGDAFDVDLYTVFEMFAEAMHPTPLFAMNHTPATVRHYVNGMLSRLEYDWQGCHIRVGADEGIVRNGRVRDIAHGAIIAFSGPLNEGYASARVFVFTRLFSQTDKYDLRPDWAYAYLVAQFVERRFNVPVTATRAVSVRLLATYKPEDIHAINDRMKTLFDANTPRPSFEVSARRPKSKIETALIDWRQFASDYRQEVSQASYHEGMHRAYRVEGWLRMGEKYGDAVLEDMRLDVGQSWVFYSMMTGEVYGRLFTCDTTLHIPEDVSLSDEMIRLTGIAPGAFSGEPITDLTLPKSVKHLGSFAFADTALTNVRFDNVEMFGKHVISNPNANVTVVVNDARFVDAEPFPEGTDVFIQARVVDRRVSQPANNLVTTTKTPTVSRLSPADAHDVQARNDTSSLVNAMASAELLENMSLIRDSIEQLLVAQAATPEQTTYDEDVYEEEMPYLYGLPDMKALPSDEPTVQDDINAILGEALIQKQDADAYTAAADEGGAEEEYPTDNESGYGDDFEGVPGPDYEDVPGPGYGEEDGASLTKQDDYFDEPSASAETTTATGPVALSPDTFEVDLPESLFPDDPPTQDEGW